MKSKITLYGFPFAGGSKYSYQAYGKHTRDLVKFIPIDYPGRGGRIREPLIDNLNSVVEDAFNQIVNGIDQPYAIYGHSMGALVSFLLVRKIEKEKLPLPLHLFVSGRAAPSIIKHEAPRYNLPKDQFKKKVQDLGGSPSEVLEDDLLFDFFEDILRADFKAIERYIFNDDSKIDTDIDVFMGDSERFTRLEADQWSIHSNGKVSVSEFEGNHFFIFNHVEKIMNLMINTLGIKQKDNKQETYIF